MRLSGRTVLVTGAASGLGRGVATYFASRMDCNVVALDMGMEGLSTLEQEVGSDRIAGVQADVTERESVASALEAGVERFGAIDVCLNFAGVVSPVHIVARDGQGVELDRFARAVAVNLTGTFNMMAQCAGYMARNREDENGERGVVVNIASAAAFDGQVGQAAYASSKAGVVGLSLPAARELARVGIRVNCIAPGAFDTPMLRSVPATVVDRIVETVQFPKRTGKIEEIAGLCVHLCENSYINGECIRLDAAMRMPPH